MVPGGEGFRTSVHGRPRWNAHDRRRSQRFGRKPKSAGRLHQRWLPSVKGQRLDAWRKGREDVGEELAGVAIYMLGLAQMTGIDLQDEIEAKMAKNAARVYQRLPNGVLAKNSREAD